MTWSVLGEIEHLVLQFNCILVLTSMCWWWPKLGKPQIMSTSRKDVTNIMYVKFSPVSIQANRESYNKS